MSNPVGALRRMLHLIERGEVRPDLIYIAVLEKAVSGVNKGDPFNVSRRADLHADYAADGRDATAEELSDLLEMHLREMFDNDE